MPIHTHSHTYFTSLVLIICLYASFFLCHAPAARCGCRCPLSCDFLSRSLKEGRITPDFERAMYGIRVCLSGAFYIEPR